MFARLLDTLDTAATVWTDVKSQAPTTQQNLVPLTKLWSEKTEEEIEAYQAVVKEQVRACVAHVNVGKVIPKRRNMYLCVYVVNIPATNLPCPNDRYGCATV